MRINRTGGNPRNERCSLQVALRRVTKASGARGPKPRVHSHPRTTERKSHTNNTQRNVSPPRQNRNTKYGFSPVGVFKFSFHKDWIFMHKSEPAGQLFYFQLQHSALAEFVTHASTHARKMTVEGNRNITKEKLQQTVSQNVLGTLVLTCF